MSDTFLIALHHASAEPLAIRQEVFAAADEAIGHGRRTLEALAGRFGSQVAIAVGRGHDASGVHWLGAWECVDGTPRSRPRAPPASSRGEA